MVVLCNTHPTTTAEFAYALKQLFRHTSLALFASPERTLRRKFVGTKRALCGNIATEEPRVRRYINRMVESRNTNWTGSVRDGVTGHPSGHTLVFFEGDYWSFTSSWAGAPRNLTNPHCVFHDSMPLYFMCLRSAERCPDEIRYSPHFPTAGKSAIENQSSMDGKLGSMFVRTLQQWTAYKPTRCS